MGQDVIDDIYEAAFAPAKWASVLDQMAQLSTSASTAMLVFSDRYAPRGMVSPALAEIFAREFVGSGEWEKSVRVRTMLSVQPRGFVPIDDYVTPAQSESDPAWLRLRAHGLQHQLCTMIQMSSGECVSFTAERRAEHGPYAPRDLALLDGLRPHLARAGLIAARLGLERAQAAVTVLEAIGLPAAVLTRTGVATAINASMETLSGMILPKAGGGLAIAGSAADALYQGSIAQMRSGALHLLRSIPVAAGPAHSAAVLHIVPIRGDARDIFSGSEYLLVASTLEAKAASASLLGTLFDLTAAETRLADRLLAGHALDKIAALHGVSITTIRSQLRSMFAKTGTSRQAQLVALLSSLWAPQDPSQKSGLGQQPATVAYRYRD